MHRVRLAATALFFVVMACADRASIPFELKADVRSVLADWRNAGLSCGDPQVGMPGPAVDWFCHRDFDGVPVQARLTADAVGVQSIIVGAPAATAGSVAAQAFVGLLGETSLVSPDRQAIEDWLLANEAADGVLQLEARSNIARVSVSSDSEGDPTLYVIPLASSMFLAE